MEFPRYISQAGNVIQPGATTQLQSQTLTLPTIPDLLIIFAKATSCTATPAFISGGGVVANNYADFYLPLQSSQCLVNSGSIAAVNPLSINFDNYSGLLSSHTAEELYAMCVHNGLEMDWAEWMGQFRGTGASYACVPAGATPANRQQGQTIPSVGSILVLRPGTDLVLQSGQSPSLVGNFTLQYNLSVYNNSPYAVQPTLYTITANSGFFESIRGSSRILKGILSEGDIINAPLAPEGTRVALDRCVGGLSFGSLANVLSRAKQAYSAAAPAISAIRSAAPGVMSAIHGSAGAGTGGGTGAGTGGGTGGRRGHRSLESRLM